MPTPAFSIVEIIGENTPGYEARPLTLAFWLRRQWAISIIR
jgi:hypothetical protein